MSALPLRLRRGGWPLLVAGMVVVSACGSSPPATLAIGESRTVEFVLEDPRIVESSGLAASIVHPGTFYTHQDMGSGAQVYAVSSETGETTAVLDLDTTAVDWEDIAVTKSGVWVGDIGGGTGVRGSITVLHFPEPATLVDGEVKVTEYTLTYTDQAHNAEGLLVDPVTDQLYVVTKNRQGGGIYAAPFQLQPGPNNLARIDKAPPNITGASFSPDGDGFALRNYARAFVYRSFDGPPTVVVELPDSQQGESLVLLEDGDLLVGSEGRRSEVLRVAVPRLRD